MNPATGPATSRSTLRWMWLFVLVLAAAAVGLHIFNLVRRPEPWPGAASGLLAPVGMIFLAWGGLLPAARTRTRFALSCIALVCIVTGLVLAVLHLYRP